MNSQIINTGIGSVEYSAVGKGIPVLFLHGGHANCHEALIHKGFDLDIFYLITPSRPGYGNTPLGENRAPVQAAGLMVELLDHLSVGKVTVYGVSAGGLTAIELASKYPDRVNKLVLASAVTKKWLDQKGSVYRTARRIFNPGVERLTWGTVRCFAAISPAFIARNFFPQFSTNPIHKLEKDDVRELILTFKYYNSGKGFLNDIDQNIAAESITKIKCPTLIIHSENDNSVPLEHAEYANEMIENSNLTILQNEWGHLFWIGGDSESTIRDIIQFIEG